MKVTTVRFGADLWRMLEREAALTGVSVSQYIREAALARAAAASALRGENPLELLAGHDGPGNRNDAAERDAELTAAAAARRTAEQRRIDTAATHAQNEQAIRRARDLTAQSAAIRDARRPERDLSG